MFVTAVTGNYASYVSYHHTHATASSGEAQAWYYDIDKVGGWAYPVARALLLCQCDIRSLPHSL